MAGSFSIGDVPLFGHNLVGASAGTGKTYAIAMLFVRLLVEARLPPSGILVVTFTEAATAELRDRVRASIREGLEIATGNPREPVDPTLKAIVERAGDGAAERLRAALYEFDQAAISTIHGFCQRTLMEQAFQSDVTFNSELFGDARPLIDDLVLDYWARELSAATPELVMYLRRQNFTPRSARSLAYTALRQPDTRILPEHAPRVTPLDPSQVWPLFERVRQIWQHPDVDVGALIRGSKVNKRRYTGRNTLRWLEQVNELFCFPTRPLLRLPPSLERFGSEVLRGDGGADIADEPVFFACEALWREQARAEAFLDSQAMEFKLRLIAFLRSELPRTTKRQNRLSFDDLLQRLREALAPPRGQALAQNLRERYPAALIDEFQDTDPVQYSIFEQIYRDSDGSLFLIGDPKQAIYSFRGADVLTYLRAEAATPSARRHTMTVNYRSDPSLLSALNTLFARQRRPFLDEQIPYQPVSARPGRKDALRAADGTSLSTLEILFVDEQLDPDTKLDPRWYGHELPRRVAREIADLLLSGARIDERALGPADVAVLTRTNDQAFQVQSALRELDVPAVVLGDKTVYRSTEAHELERLLRAIVEPSNAGLVKAALATELLGVSAPEICALEHDDSQWEAWLGDFRAWNTVWSQIGFVQMFRALMTRRFIQERLLKLNDGERRMTNLLHLAELLHSAAVRSHLGPTGLLAFLSQQIRREAFGVEADAEQIRLESDARAVKITTMHKSKGLEYPVVFCPYLWGAMLRHPNDTSPRFHLPDGDIALDLGSSEREENQARAEREVYAENLRLAYVALTRARHRCTLVWGKIGTYASSPLGYLLHPIERGSLDFLDAPAANDTADAARSEGEAPAADVTRQQQHLRGLSSADMLAELERLSQCREIVLRRIPPQTPPGPGLARPYTSRGLEHRAATARIDHRFRTSSFSALTTSSEVLGRHATGAAELLPDHDVAPDDELSQAPPQPDTPLVLADFPRGAKAGSFFHELFEHSDFTAPRPAPLLDLAREKLAVYRFPVEPWEQRVCRGIWSVLDTPLAEHTGASPLELGKVPLARRLNELEFCLPVLERGKPAGAREHALDAGRLARVFRQHPSPALPASYAEALATLDFVPLVGFLRGYIDLVVMHEGRYFVFDYKTNHLGDTAADYGPAGLAEGMRHGHYFLQYHLYALAVHRYLARRLADYRYDSHFGGVYYLFIKGMHPELGASGVFYEKPPLERLMALSELLELSWS
jgi:exodeoxyribonuclease V beta subunit